MKPRIKKCKQCGEKYRPRVIGQLVCSLQCSVPYGRKLAAKAADKKHKARKKALKDNDKSAATKAAQKAFNSYIRARDFDKNCVSCGRYHQGQWHAGHYRPVGGQGAALRFNEINCFRQCSVCNNHKSGALTEFRIELIRRIGLPLVEWLEKDHPPANWTVPELRAIRDYYLNAVKQMQQTAGEFEPF